MSSDVERLPLALYLPELQKLREAKTDFILVAGQAVNFWAEFYSERNPALRTFAPFASKDVDLFGSLNSLLKLPGVLDGQLKRFKDVRQPVVGVFTTSSDPPLKFELLRSIYGPVSAEKISQRAQVESPIRVIDPVSLLVSKCHNAGGIDQEKRQDVRHVQMMVLVSEAYYEELTEGIGQHLTPRQFINECKYLLEFADNATFQKGLAMAKATLSDCIPVDAIEAAGAEHGAVGRFFENTLRPRLQHPNG